MRQVAQSLENVDSSFHATAIPGNAELASEVNIANEQQQVLFSIMIIDSIALAECQVKICAGTVPLAALLTNGASALCGLQGCVCLVASSVVPDCHAAGT